MLVTCSIVWGEAIYTNKQASNDGVLIANNKHNKIYPDYIKTPQDIEDWLIKEGFQYIPDKTKEDEWKPPEKTVKDKGGDCVSENQKIWTKDGIKSAKDITYNDFLLSYDFKNKVYSYKPILKIWYKGKKKIFRIHFRNGTYIDVTNKHKLLIKKGDSYIIEQVKNLKLDLEIKIRVPIFKKLPYIVKDNKYFSEDLCYVIGHYLAEGYKDKKHVRTCGMECIKDIVPILKRNNIPYSIYYNKKGLPIITFLKSEFKDYLKRIKNNSLDMKLTEELLNLPENKLEKIIEGFLLGDGHYNDFDFKDKTLTRNKEYTLSTSSLTFTQDLQTMGLKIGKPFHIWKQEKHGGLGKHPIWRVTYNPKSWFSKEYGYSFLSEVSIKFIEELSIENTYDFMIQDNHNFVCENGVIVHNCEDYAILADYILEDLGYKNSMIIAIYAPKLAHGICWFQDKDGTWSFFSTGTDGNGNNRFYHNCKVDNPLKILYFYFPEWTHMKLCVRIGLSVNTIYRKDIGL